MSAPVQAATPDYWLVGMADNAAFIDFIDVSTIKSLPNGHRTYWQTTIYNPAARLHPGVDFYKALSEIDCDARKSRILYVVYYSPTGTVVKSETGKEYDPFEYIVPDTVGSQDADFVCATQADWPELGAQVGAEQAGDIVKTGQKVIASLLKSRAEKKP